MANSEALRKTYEHLVEMKRRRDENWLAYYQPYDKQKQFHNLTRVKREVLMSAGNQQGKTLAGAAQAAFLATGRYPEWYKGRRFDGPTRGWVIGQTNEATRDNPQRLLLGEIGKEGTGMIPKDAIKQVIMARGIPEAVDTLIVKHVSGGLSQISFKSCERGRQKLQGESLHWVWADEEPPPDIYSELLARITARSGMIYTTFTPLLGRSVVVNRFLDDLNHPDRGYVRMTLADAKHIPEEERQRIIEGYLPHEREARVNGLPMMGSGLIFPVAREAISVEPFAVPDSWPRICGMDFGIDHPTAAAWVAVDENTDTCYVYDVYRKSDANAIVHAAAVKAKGDIVVAWPHDALIRDKGSGETLAQQYKSLGLRMLPDRATFPDGGNGLEAGLAMMLEMMITGKLKVFRHCEPLFEEMSLYHRKDGVVVRLVDDTISALRYALMMRRYARLAGRPRRALAHAARDVDFPLT